MLDAWFTINAVIATLSAERFPLRCGWGFHSAVAGY